MNRWKSRLIVVVLFLGLGWITGRQLKSARDSSVQISDTLNLHVLDDLEDLQKKSFSNFSNRIHSMPVEYFPVLLEAINALPQDNRMEMGALVCKIWGQREPEIALADTESRAAWIFNVLVSQRAVLTGWVEVDFDAAWEAADHVRYGKGWQSWMIESVMPSDTGRAVILIERYLRALSKGRNDERWLTSQLTLLAKEIPDEAIRLAKLADASQKFSRSRMEFLVRKNSGRLTYEFAISFSRSNPELGSRVIEALQSSGFYDVAVAVANDLVSYFEANELGKEFEHELEKAIERAEKFERFEMALSDPVAALTDEGSSDRVRVAEKWIKDDPVVAGAMLLERIAAGDEDSSSFIDVVFSNDEAFTDAEIWNVAVVKGLEYSGDYLGTERMLQLAKSIPEASENVAFLKSFARNWDSNDRAGAEEWIASQPEEIKDTLRFEYLDQEYLDQEQGAAMLEFLREHPASRYHVEALRRVGNADPFADHSWLSDDETEMNQVIANARAWLMNLPESDRDTWLQSELASDSDLVGFTRAFPEELLAQLPEPGDELDGSHYGSIITSWAEFAPDSAVAYLLKSPPPITLSTLPALSEVFVGAQPKVDKALELAASYGSEERFELLQHWVDHAGISSEYDPFADVNQDLDTTLRAVNRLIEESDLSAQQRGDLWQSADRQLLLPKS